MDMNLGEIWEMVRDRKVWHAALWGLQRVGHDLVTKQQQVKRAELLMRLMFF